METLLIEYEQVGSSGEQPQGYYVIGRFQVGEHKIEVTEMCMLKWMCGNIMMD